MIGLIDGDTYSCYKDRYLPNLQLMKLYGYLKDKGQVVKLLQYPQQMNGCTEIFLRSQHHDSPILDDRFFVHPNLHLGGNAYTDGIYRPFKNEQIEYYNPNYRLYRQFILKSKRKLTPKMLVESGYARLSLPEFTWKDQIIPKHHMFIYDDNPLQYYDILMDLIQTVGALGFQHPFQINNFEDYEHAKNLYYKKQRGLIKIHLGLLFNIDMDIETFKKFIQQEISFLRQIRIANFLVNLTIDNPEKIQYNIIETIKKRNQLILNGILPGLYYKNLISNPYAQLCDVIDYQSYCFQQRHHVPLHNLCVTKEQINQFYNLGNKAPEIIKGIHLSDKKLLGIWGEGFYDK